MSPDVAPIPDAPALLADDALVVADLHIGKEEELREAGITLPSQARKMGDDVVALLEAHAPRRLVILGDLKHQFPKSTGLERREVPRFLDRVEGLVSEVHVVQGNHDGHLGHILPRGVLLHGAEGVRLGEVGLAHGHAWPAPEVMEAPTLLMGHNHPTLRFPDRLGLRRVRRCWIRAPFGGTLERYPALPGEAVILPAFNPFSGGTTMNETGSRYLGPVLGADLVDMPRAQVYLLDGLHLGRLRDMMVPGKGETVE